MHDDALNAIVLNAAANPDKWLLEVLAGLPQLRVVGEATGPEDCLSQHRKVAVDLVVVDLDHETTLPEWLEGLTQSLPQTAVMVCSHNQERDFLIRAMQLGVREFLLLPLSGGDLEAALDRVRAAKRRRFAAGTRLGQIVTVTGLKGGVGTTSIAVNLAVALAEKWPNRVVLVDLGRPFPDVAKFLDQGRKNNLLDLAAHSDHLDAPFVLKTVQPHKAKLGVLHGCPEFKDWDHITPAVLGKVWAILRTLFDWIVVDLSLWPDDLYRKVVQEADQVLLLTELMIPDMKNLKKLWALFRQWGLKKDKVKVVVNHSHKDNGLGLADLERIQQKPVFFTLPSDEALNESINHGIPLAEAAPRSKLCRSLRRLAEELASQFQSDSLDEVPALPKTRRRFLFF